MSENVSELCVLLVQDLLGELASQILAILLRYGRVHMGSLKVESGLPFRYIKHGLAVLLQHQLVFWHTSHEHTVYEVNCFRVYNLVRMGKFTQMVTARFGELAGQIVSSLLLLGHARVQDLVEICGYHSSVNSHEQHPVKAASNILRNGFKMPAYSNQEQTPSHERIHAQLFELFRAGLVSPLNESHFRSDADNRLEAEKIVPPPESYKVKSKKDRDMQWQASVQKQLENWKYGSEQEVSSFSSYSKGRKRPLEQAENLQEQKRQKIGELSRNSHSRSQVDNWRYLDDDLILRANESKASVFARNFCLVQLSERFLGTSTSKIYDWILCQMESGIRACQDEFREYEALDEETEIKGLIPVSTEDIVAALGSSKGYASALAELDPARLDSGVEDHPKKRRRKMDKHAQDESIADKEISLGGDGEEKEEDNEQSENREDEGDVRSLHSEFLKSTKSGPRPQRSKVPPKHDESRCEAIRNHLILLAQHPYQFLLHLPETSTSPEQWTVHFHQLIKTLQHHTIYDIITARYGMAAARIVRLVAEKGRCDEKFIQNLSLMNQKTMRSHLTSLHGASLLFLQDIPRDSSRNPQRSLFAWYFDLERCKGKLLDETYKAMARCWQRLKVEKEDVRATMDKATRSDIVGKEEQFLTPQELQALEIWKDKESKLLTEIGRLDDLVGIFRDY